MRTSLVFVCACSFPLLAAPLAAQQTWKVCCSGAYGAQFTDLPPAVAAAAPGDTILIYLDALGGPCSSQVPYTAPVITKPLKIVGAVIYGGAPSSQWMSADSSIFVEGRIEIRNIAAGETVYLSGIGISALSSAGQPSQLVVEDCAGTVVIERMEYRSMGFLGHEISIRRSVDVTLQTCFITLSGLPILAEDSYVQMVTTFVYHSWPLPYVMTGLPLPYPETRIPALSLLRSQAALVETGMTGFNAGVGPPWEPAIRLDQSTLRIGPGSWVASGAGMYGAAFLAASPVSTSSAVVDPRATVIGATWNPPTPTPMVAEVSAMHNWPITSDHPYYASVFGPPGGFALAVLGHLAPTPLTTPWGSLAWVPGTELPIALVALPVTDGSTDIILQCPPLAPVGIPFVFQALTLSPSGEFGLTLPSPAMVGWQPGLIP